MLATMPRLETSPANILRFLAASAVALLASLPVALDAAEPFSLWTHEESIAVEDSESAIPETLTENLQMVQCLEEETYADEPGYEEVYDEGTNWNSPSYFPAHVNLFNGIDASRQPQDFGVNALFGGRLHINTSWFLNEETGLALQAGTGFNYSDNGVQVFERIEGTQHRYQSFSTFGLFQRGDNGITWGAGFDLLYQDYYDNFLLGQWRGNLGITVTENDDLGVWFAIPQISDRGNFGSIPVKLKPIQQVNFYWKRIWPSSVVTTNWVGWANEHGEVNVVLGDYEPNGPCFIYGTELHAPLNDYLAIFGQGNFIRPADTGTLDAYLGIVLYLGGGAKDAPYRRDTPVLAVANNPTFSNDLSR